MRVGRSCFDVPRSDPPPHDRLPPTEIFFTFHFFGQTVTKIWGKILSQDILFVSLGKFQTFRRATVKSRTGGRSVWCGDSERDEPIPRGTFLVIIGLLVTSRKMDSLQWRRILGRRKLPVYVRTVVDRYIHILYLNTIWFKAQSLWGRVNAIFDVMTEGG